MKHSKEKEQNWGCRYATTVGGTFSPGAKGFVTFEFGSELNKVRMRHLELSSKLP
jgi:hypothetical protein